MEADLRCHKEVLTEMKKARTQPSVDYFFKKTNDSQNSASALEASSMKPIKIRHFIKIKFYT